MLRRRSYRRRELRFGFESLEARLALAVSFVFDYSYDSLGFFTANPAAKAVLQEAGQILGSQINDKLAPIVPIPGTGNTWSIDFANPSTGVPISISNPSVAANTLVIYVGGTIPTASLAGEGGPGGFSSMGSSDWNNLVSTRFATGMGGSWGGSISFSTQIPWCFAGIAESPASNEYDFLTIALHELGHVLGIGTSDEWYSQVNTENNTFNGAHSEAMYGGPVPLNTSGQTADTHWASGLDSFGQEPVLAITPVLNGQRKSFTSLDWAGLQDLGWHTNHLAFTTEPASILKVGTPFSLAVSILDPNGQVDSTFNGAVTLSLASNPGNATLSGTLKVNAQNGVATFSGLTLDKVGVGYSLKASADLVASATTGDLTVGAIADVGHVVFSAVPPSSITAGDNFGFTVLVQNSAGQTLTNFNGPVTASLTGSVSGASLMGTLTVNASAGLATFSGLAITRAAANYQIQVSAASITSGLSAAFTVIPAAASKLVVKNQPPANVIAGTPFSLTVHVADTYGNLRTDRADLVGLSLGSNPSGDVLVGSTAINAQAGIVTFTGVLLNKSATGVTVRVNSAGLASAQTNAFNVVPSAPARVDFVTQPPTSVNTGSGFGYVIQVWDASGNLATNFNGTATASLVANPGSSTLAGPVAVNVAGGQAVFSGLTLNYPGDSYRLQVTLSTGVAGFSNTFNVLGAPGNGGTSQNLSIVRVAILTTGSGRRKKTIGFEIGFNSAVDVSRAMNSANYVVLEKVRRGRTTTSRQVGVSPSFGSASSIVRLNLVGNRPFAMGGSLTVKSSYPVGIMSATGNYLTGKDTVFTILKNLKGIH